MGRGQEGKLSAWWQRSRWVVTRKVLGMNLDGTRQRGKGQTPSRWGWLTRRWKVEQATIYYSGLVESWGDDIVLENFQGISNTSNRGWKATQGKGSPRKRSEALGRMLNQGTGLDYPDEMQLRFIRHLGYTRSPQNLSVVVIFIMGYYCNFSNDLSEFDLDDVTEAVLIHIQICLPISYIPDFPTQIFSSFLPDFDIIHLYFLKIIKILIHFCSDVNSGPS